MGQTVWWVFDTVDWHIHNIPCSAYSPLTLPYTCIPRIRRTLSAIAPLRQSSEGMIKTHRCSLGTAGVSDSRKALTSQHGGWQPTGEVSLNHSDTGLARCHCQWQPTRPTDEPSVDCFLHANGIRKTVSAHAPNDLCERTDSRNTHIYIDPI